MHALRIVEALDVVEDRKASLLSGREVEVVDPLGLESVEEALGDRVVFAVSWTAHAADDAMAIEPILVLGAQVLPRFKGSSQQWRVGLNVGDRSTIRQGSSIQGFCVGAC